MSFTEAVQVCIAKIMTFEGRARRSEYWYYTLVVMCISLVLSLLQNITGWNLFSVLSGLVSLALLVPGLGLAWRRLHDIGKSGRAGTLSF